MSMKMRGRAALATLVIAAGGAGTAGIAAAASDTTATATTATAATTTAPATGTAAQAAPDPTKVSHGPGETLLTGSDAEKATTAALAAVPGATVLRVETDSGGAAYEAHMTKADGSQVTVLFDSSFNVTSTVDGFGPGPAGGQAPAGASGQSATPAA